MKVKGEICYLNDDDDRRTDEGDNLLGGIHEHGGLEDMQEGIQEEEGTLKVVVVGSVHQGEDILREGILLVVDMLVGKGMNHEGSVQQHIQQDEKKALFHYYFDRCFPFRFLLSDDEIINN